jgi:glutamate-ammonia-ligase adenylyltransferase
MPISVPLPRDLAALLDRRMTRLEGCCREQGVPFYDDAGVDDHLMCVLLASDFAYESFVRDPFLLGPELVRLMGDPRHADARAGAFATPRSDRDMHAELRRFRRSESLRLIWRDVNGIDSVDTILTGASVLADTCIEAALAHAERAIAPRHGTLRDANGVPQRLVVLALGKLGGGELNFSSDVDLVFAHAAEGRSDGPRPLDAEAWFNRVARHVVALLGEVGADGFAFRVDLRLRPFGNAGALVPSFAAMERYYQREGRDWERYAWIKARPVAGDRSGATQLLDTLRPFVFRRYLDYGAFAGLREMKALIDAEVARKDLADNLKLGPGGIREIEFIVQLAQMIRGGREPALRVPGLLPALAACEQLGLIPASRARRLGDAYRLLRKVENRVQMFADRQTHELPAEIEARRRIALGLGHPDGAQLEARLDACRTIVMEEFAALMAPGQRARRASADSVWADAWRRFASDGVDAGVLAGHGFPNAAAAAAALSALLGSSALRAMSARARERLDHLMPAILAAAVATEDPAATLARLLDLVQAVARRSVYLALLTEQPAALRRLTEVFSASAFLAAQVARHPLLLDELFDDRSDAAPFDAAAVGSAIARRLAMLPGPDPEAEIESIQEERLAALFRVGLAFLGARIDAIATARSLAEVAEAVLDAVLRIAERDIIAAHGHMDRRADDGCGLAVIAYGSLGAAELGFASDLDLVFLYDAALGTRESDGPRPLDGARYYTRLAQRIVHLLTTPLRSGRLYEIDVRLRPDGGTGLLVTSFDAFVAYQTGRAWIWERQALVRARGVAGDAVLSRKFAAARERCLVAPFAADDPERSAAPVDVRAEIVAMRARWRAERDRSDAASFDLKQGAGGLVDIEFLLQAIVLQEAARHPQLLASGNTPALVGACVAAGSLRTEQGEALAAAHSAFLQRALACTLDARPRVVPRTAGLEAHAFAVLDVAHASGLAFR